MLNARKLGALQSRRSSLVYCKHHISARLRHQTHCRGSGVAHTTSTLCSTASCPRKRVLASSAAPMTPQAGGEAAASQLPRVAVFTTTGCPYCKRAKQALSDQGLPYQEISVEDASLRGVMKDVTGSSSVPKVCVEHDWQCTFTFSWSRGS